MLRFLFQKSGAKSKAEEQASSFAAFEKKVGRVMGNIDSWFESKIAKIEDARDRMLEKANAPDDDPAYDELTFPVYRREFNLKGFRPGDVTPEMLRNSDVLYALAEVADSLEAQIDLRVKTAKPSFSLAALIGRKPEEEAAVEICIDPNKPFNGSRMYLPEREHLPARVMTLLK